MLDVEAISVMNMSDLPTRYTYTLQYTSKLLKMFL